MDDLKIADYSFDDLVKLNKENPEEFEKVRKHIIETQIIKMTDDVEKQQRLRAISHSFDVELSKYQDSHVRYIKAQEIFYNQFHKFNDVLNNRLPTNKKAEILDFKSKIKKD